MQRERFNPLLIPIYPILDYRRGIRAYNHIHPNRAFTTDRNAQISTGVGLIIGFVIGTLAVGALERLNLVTTESLLSPAIIITNGLFGGLEGLSLTPPARLGRRMRRNSYH